MIHEGETVTLLQFVCPTTMVIEFARIKRRSCASVATFEKYRAICERQRRRVFTASTAQDDAPDPPTD